MSFFDAVRASVRRGGKHPGPQSYAALGRKIVCPHCGHDRFARHDAVLSSALASFFNLDWTGKQGTALVCANCQMIQWFAKRPDAVTTP